MKGVLMPDIYDYLDWRGDIPARSDNINEVDNMIFSLLSYVNFERVFEALEHHRTLTMREAAKEYFFTHDEKNPRPLGLIVPAVILDLFRRLAETPRYRDLELFGYVNEICPEKEMQFSAITIKLGDGGLFVAFRGTDDTLVGWKEDFKLAYLEEVPSQAKAVAYLNALPLEENTALYVGGHSKGGNLAVWGATHAKQEVQDHIRHVYSNDGPGFFDAMLRSEAYLRLANRITFLIPQSSLVGLLLANDGKYQIVKSRNLGVFQHDGMSWEVMGASFVRQEKLTSRGIRTDTVVRERIDSMSKEDKRAFVELFFEMLAATGATTLTELMEGYAKNALAIFKTFQSFDKDKRDLITYIVGMLFDIRSTPKKNPPKQKVEGINQRQPEQVDPHKKVKALPPSVPVHQKHSKIRLKQQAQKIKVRHTLDIHVEWRIKWLRKQNQ